MVREPWRAHPLAWIHRAEARSIARELGAQLISGKVPPGSLLRLSDPVMVEAVHTLRVPYFGPGSAALERCYDKYEACRRVAGAPRTFLASEAHSLPVPFVLKPRRGSDSIGVQLVGDVPPGVYIMGTEIEGKKVFRRVTVEAGKLSWVVFKP